MLLKLSVASLSGMIIIVGATFPFGCAASDSRLSNSGLYTYYQAGGNLIQWETCGYTSTGDGCYGSGLLGPFGHACAVVGDRDFTYVADSDSLVGGTLGGHATIYVYRQIVSPSPSVDLVHTITLPIPNSAEARCSMAYSGNFLYFGTDRVPSFYKIDRSTLAIVESSICDFPTTSIYASNDFVVINQAGACEGIYDLNGNQQQNGGETVPTFFPSRNAYIP